LRNFKVFVSALVGGTLQLGLE